MLGELGPEQTKRLTAGIELEDGVAKFGELEFIGGEGSNRWYRVTIHEGRNREVRRMFEAAGVTVSRLIRTRFGEVVLPRKLRRGRWEELEPNMATALMLRLGLAREVTGDSDSDSRGRRGQPLSHDSALPPGFGTMEQNGSSGARLNRRGNLRGASRSGNVIDPTATTGLLISGGWLMDTRKPGVASQPGIRISEAVLRVHHQVLVGLVAALMAGVRGRLPISRRRPIAVLTLGQLNRQPETLTRPHGLRLLVATRGRTRGDDWQPSGSNAHESKLARIGSGRR